ncbi:NAD(P)-dependent alcohol dehydrogenase [Luteimonas sp. MC1828]|uniref:zinc-dependent alcohol dehydrogenase family protein n=1 Tax=Luteimonas sp. MC1828 TaxID=2799787 RepID=UPI0018F2452E|nr:NAD(P)-dependent alcohol dehydrogenase [Luteimonas sp. MC1828]MBJ7576101.1 NAD(P)-dependent alcohol dehydrogenase [Luteimonas sp. MC1828]
MTIKTLYISAGGGFEHVTTGITRPVEPAAGEITVRLHASSLNFHDYLVVSGVTGPTEQRIPMSDGAGEVTALGAGVTEFAVGDRVVSTFFPDWLDGEAPADGFSRVPGDGIDGYAREQVTARATAFTHAPRGWSHAEAATLTTAGLTAWRALMEDGALQPGQVVLVQGSGGVSVFALQLAKLAGARVIATSSSDAKLERLRALGADEVINYRQDPQWGVTAQRLTGGRGVDHVLDVGGPDTLEQSMLACRVGGHVSLIGVLTGVDARIPLALALARQLRLQGLVVGNRRQQQDMVRALDAGSLRPVIDRHFALDDLVAAFRHQESGSHFGKIVLDL